MKKILFISIIINIVLAQSIDADKSQVKFTVRNMGVRNVVGTITDMMGTLKFNSTKNSKNRKILRTWMLVNTSNDDPSQFVN